MLWNQFQLGAAGAMEYRPDSPPERISAATGVIRASAHHGDGRLG